jgi:hypothetical protein
MTRRDPKSLARANKWAQVDFLVLISHVLVVKTKITTTAVFYVGIRADK